MGVAQRVDGMGAIHPGRELHSQHGCGGMQRAFHDAPDPQLQAKVGHFMTIARVPDCIELLPFNQLREAFNSYSGATTAIRLIRLHRRNMVFPDMYFQFYGKHFTIMGLLDPEIRFGTAARHQPPISSFKQVVSARQGD